MNDPKRLTLATLPSIVSSSALSCIPVGEQDQFRSNPEEYLRLKRNKLLAGEWSIKACPRTAALLWEAVATIAHLLPPTWPRHPRKAFDKSPLAWLKAPGFNPKLWLATLHAVEQHSLLLVDSWHAAPELHRQLSNSLEAGYADRWRVGEPLLKSYEKLVFREIVGWAPSVALTAILDRQLSPDGLRELQGLPQALEEVAARPLRSETSGQSDAPSDVIDAAIFALLEQTSSFYPQRDRIEVMLRQRLGLTSKGVTLQEVGDMHGLTRERVRQLLSFYANYELLPKAHRHKLAAVVQAIACTLPGSLSKASQPVLDLVAGLDAVTLCEQLSEFASMPCPAVTLNAQFAVDIYRMCVPTDAAPLVDLVAWTARRHIVATGLCYPGRVLLEAFEKRTEGNPSVLTPAFVLAVFEQRLHLKPVAAEGSSPAWYWAGPERGTTLTGRIRKALSVTENRIDAQQLHAAVYKSSSRDFNRDDLQIIPSASVLLAVASQLPNIEARMGNDVFRVDPTKDGVAVLSQTEGSIYRTLLAHAGICSRGTLIDAVTADIGVTSVAVSYVLADSPITIALGDGLYQLLGHPLKSEAMALAATKVPNYGTRMQVRRKPPNGDSTIRTEKLPEGGWRIYIRVVELTLELGTAHFAKTCSDGLGETIEVEIEQAAILLPIRRWETTPGNLIARLSVAPLLRILQPDPNTLIELCSRADAENRFEIAAMMPIENATESGGLVRP